VSPSTTGVAYLDTFTFQSLLWTVPGFDASRNNEGGWLPVATFLDQFLSVLTYEFGYAIVPEADVLGNLLDTRTIASAYPYTALSGDASFSSTFSAALPLPPAGSVLCVVSTVTDNLGAVATTYTEMSLAAPADDSATVLGTLNDGIAQSIDSGNSAAALGEIALAGDFITGEENGEENGVANSEQLRDDYVQLIDGLVGEVVQDTSGLQLTMGAIESVVRGATTGNLLQSTGVDALRVCKRAIVAGDQVREDAGTAVGSSNLGWAATTVDVLSHLLESGIVDNNRTNATAPTVSAAEFQGTVQALAGSVTNVLQPSEAPFRAQAAKLQMFAQNDFAYNFNGKVIAFAASDGENAGDDENASDGANTTAVQPSRQRRQKRRAEEDTVPAAAAAVRSFEFPADFSVYLAGRGETRVNILSVAYVADPRGLSFNVSSVTTLKLYKGLSEPVAVEGLPVDRSIRITLPASDDPLEQAAVISYATSGSFYEPLRFECPRPATDSTAPLEVPSSPCANGFQAAAFTCPAYDNPAWNGTADGVAVVRRFCPASVPVASCVWFNTTAGVYSTDGCAVSGITSSGEVVCSCTHLTDFGTQFDSIRENAETSVTYFFTTSPAELATAAARNVLVLVSLAGVFGLYFSTIAAAFKRERQVKAARYEAEFQQMEPQAAILLLLHRASDYSNLYWIQRNETGISKKDAVGYHDFVVGSQQARVEEAAAIDGSFSNPIYSSQFGIDAVLNIAVSRKRDNPPATKNIEMTSYDTGTPSGQGSNKGDGHLTRHSSSHSAPSASAGGRNEHDGSLESSIADLQNHTSKDVERNDSDDGLLLNESPPHCPSEASWVQGHGSFTMALSSRFKVISPRSNSTRTAGEKIKGGMRMNELEAIFDLVAKAAGHSAFEGTAEGNTEGVALEEAAPTPSLNRAQLSMFLQYMSPFLTRDQRHEVLESAFSPCRHPAEMTRTEFVRWLSGATSGMTVPRFRTVVQYLQGYAAYESWLQKQLVDSPQLLQSLEDRLGRHIRDKRVDLWEMPSTALQNGDSLSDMTRLTTTHKDNMKAVRNDASLNFKGRGGVLNWPMQAQTLASPVSPLPPQGTGGGGAEDTLVTFSETQARAATVAQTEKAARLDSTTIDIKRTYWQGLLDEHPVLGSIYRYSMLNRKILLTVLLCELLGSMFIDALLYDRAYGEGRIGELNFEFGNVAQDVSEDGSSNMGAGSGAEDVASNILEFVLFGIIAALVGKVPVIFILQLFRKTKRLQIGVKNFEQLSLQMCGARVTADMPSWALRLEMQRALARERVVRRHFNAFNAEQRDKDLSVPDRSFVLEIARRDVSDLQLLVHTATKREARLLDVEVMRELDRRELQWYEIRMWKSYQLKKARRQKRQAEGLQYLMENGFTVLQLEKMKENERYKEGLSPFKRWLYRNSFETEEEKVLAASRYVQEYRRYRNVALACTVAWCSWCTFFCLAFAFSQNDGSVTEAWLKAFGVSVVFDFCLYSPISVFFKFIAIPIFALWYLGDHVKTLKPDPPQPPAFAIEEPDYDPNEVTMDFAMKPTSSPVFSEATGQGEEQGQLQDGGATPSPPQV
jgi:hypothetical protein